MVCKNERVVINNLRTTVEGLEAELRNLRETGCGQCGGQNASLLVRKVWINGDSNGSDIADLVRGMVTGGKTVEGARRSGAKLQAVNSDVTPPTGNCYVLIAGTNDLAALLLNNIYRHLELCITAKLTTAKVIVSTLPHQHDLSTNYPINKETALVNAYIDKNCALGIVGRNSSIKNGEVIQYADDTTLCIRSNTKQDLEVKACIELNALLKDKSENY
ncbi:hypothetical protein J6590_037847 [Homalodisca vitripennis]|nr:hypothetical protein J6590_037847 [Homalodisca vitripennis]